MIQRAALDDDGGSKMGCNNIEGGKEDVCMRKIKIKIKIKNMRNYEQAKKISRGGLEKKKKKKKKKKEKKKRRK